MISLTQYSLLITLTVGSLLIAALIIRRDSRTPHVLLSLSLLGTIFFQLVLSLKVSGDIRDWPLLWRSPLPIAVWVNTLLYFYILSLTVPGFKLVRIPKTLYLPFILAFSWYLFFQFLPRDSIFWTDPEVILWERYCRGIFSFIIKSFFLYLCFYQLYKYSREVKAYFSTLKGIRLYWLRNLLIILTIPWLFRGLDLLTGPYWTIDKIAAPVISLIILFIGYLGLRQSMIFTSQEAEVNEFLSSAPKSALNEYERIRFDKDIEDKKPIFFTEPELVEWKNKLQAYMEQEKPYLNPELRLTDLAKEMRLKGYKISEILNRGFGETFYHFINRYRVLEAQERLGAPEFDYMNILGIANDSGFNSKSVFNDVFRKMTGVTPSEFRKSVSHPSKA